MFVLFAVCMALVGRMSMAVPLENPSSDLVSSAALGLESPSSHLKQHFDSRIVGGSVAPRVLSRHAIGLVVGWQFTSFVCGGSLVKNDIVLTAYHCIMLDWFSELLDSFHGVAGTSTWNSGGLVIIIETFVGHPKYDPVNIKFDLAILKLAEPVKFTEMIQPICLDYNRVGGGVRTYVTGWGTTAVWGAIPDHLQILYPQTLTAAQCEQKIENVTGQWGSIPPRDYKSEICTFLAFGKGVCHGDSGSALVDLRTGCQIGMVVWGFPCGVGAPDMYGWLGASKWLIEESMTSKW